MRNKSNIRVVGEVVTLINNILITLSIVGGFIYLYLIEPISKALIKNTINEDYDMLPL